jgi:hypothetical protein
MPEAMKFGVGDDVYIVTSGNAFKRGKVIDAKDGYGDIPPHSEPQYRVVFTWNEPKAEWFFESDVYPLNIMRPDGAIG